MENCNSKCKVAKKALNFIIITLIFNFALLTLNLRHVSAFTMSNDNYIIEGDFNSGSGRASNNTHKITATIGGNAPGVYTGKNYKVTSGFDFGDRNVSQFTFSLSNALIDFGLLSPTNSVTRTSTITISSTASGYQLVVYENHPLRSTANAVIPNTTCDNGSCTEITGAPWTNTLTYGFGYRCDNVAGTNCEASFAQADYFKQFTDYSKKQASPQIVMKATAPNQKAKSEITYKVNISGTQRPGAYSNRITYLATPSF